MKPSYSFVLALLSCANTVVFANSPVVKKVQVEQQTSAEVSTAGSNAGVMPSLRFPNGTGSFNPHVKARILTCATCSLTPKGAIVPSNAVAVSEIQAMTNWKGDQDSGGSGSASGSTGLVSNPALTGNARQFKTSFTNGGSERFYSNFGADTNATHFLYDGWVYVASPNNTVANVEMDMNQVMANGQTVIFGVQCDGYSNTWDYTANQGSPQNPNDVWLHAKATCNPRNWSANAWHHIQITYSRDDAGNVTYESVWLDGARQDLNVTVPSAFALGWGSALLTNFQVDGLGASGTTTVYLDNLTIYRW